MNAFLERQKIAAFLRSCIECSVHLAPTEPGLTYLELAEAGKRANLKEGEISDAMRDAVDIRFANTDRLMPRDSDTVMWLEFTLPRDPDFRDFDSFNFVFAQMHDAAREYGVDGAKLERKVLVRRAISQGLHERKTQAAVTMIVLAGVLDDAGGILSYRRGKSGYASPAMQRANSPASRSSVRSEALAKAYPIVEDIIARRIDGRPVSIEPLDAFAAVLDKLGYGAFRMWWTQMAAEVRQTSPQTSPVSCTVLSAALVEGALTFVVRHARDLGLGPMGSKSFDTAPTSWRIDDLLSSAASGRNTAILNQTTLARANTLIRARQRIHAGRMLSDFPGGPPELRPEEARDAFQTAEIVVRSILDWLDQHPPVNEAPSGT